MTIFMIGFKIMFKIMFMIMFMIGSADYDPTAVDDIKVFNEKK